MSRILRSMNLLYFLGSVAFATPPLMKPSATSSTQLDTLSSSDVDYLAHLLSSNDSSTGLSLTSTLNTDPSLNPDLNLSAISEARCWAHHGFRLDPQDYLKVIEEIVSEPAAMEHKRWTLSVPRPVRWGITECRIVLGVVPSTPGTITTDAFQPVYVAHLATKIAAKCLKPEEGFHGGVIRFGPDFRLGVVLGSGRREPQGVTVTALEAQ